MKRDALMQAHGQIRAAKIIHVRLATGNLTLEWLNDYIARLEAAKEGVAA